jgi:hypothetical protein
VLKTDSLKPLAQILRSKGRKGDTILAHISPKEAARLKREGGSGTINPDTGLPEFFGEDGFDYPTFDVPSFSAPFEAPVEAPVSAPVEANYPVQDQSFRQSEIASLGNYAQQMPESYGQTFGLADIPAAGAFETGGFSDYARNLFGGGQTGGYAAAPSGVPLPPLAKFTTPEETAKAFEFEGQPAQVVPLSEGAAAEGAKAATGEDKGIFGKLGLGDLAKLGIGGIGALMGRQQQNEALKQAQALQAQYQANAAAAAQQQKELAAPLLTPGYSALAQANQGTLTAANQQAFQAMQARLAQSQARSGGVGAIQTAVAEEAARQQALSNQITQAMQLIGPGNTLANQAIQTNLLGQQGGLQLGISLSQQANQAAMNMYGALAKFVAG